MVAIGPQTERQSDFMAGQHGLPFPVLSDPGCALAEKFGLVYTVPEYLRELLPLHPGQHSLRQRRTELAPAHPRHLCTSSATARVLFAEAHADFRVRPEPEEALAAAFAPHSR